MMHVITETNLLKSRAEHLTTMFSKRVTKACYDNSLIKEKQEQFRDNNSTSDHTFVIKNFIDLFQRTKKNYTFFICTLFTEKPWISYAVIYYATGFFMLQFFFFKVIVLT